MSNFGRRRAETIRRDNGVQFTAIIHPLESSSIIIMYPGYDEDVDGYNAKYRQIAEYLCQEKELGAVVRTGNPYYPQYDYSQSVIDNLRSVVEFALGKSSEICGSVKPELYLMGYSAGAGAVAGIASEYEQIKKILLIAPSSDAKRESVLNSLKEYRGEFYSAVGEEDIIASKFAAELYSSFAVSAAVNKWEVIPECDHTFSGEKNGRIFSSLPLWAFGGAVPEPSPEYGIKLY